MHEIDFKVPLSGSQLFDYHSYVTAKNLCSMFPNLQFTMKDNVIHIFGELNDVWYEQWCKAIFTIGEIKEI